MIKGRDVVAEEMEREGVNGERGTVGWVGSHSNPMKFSLSPPPPPASEIRSSYVTYMAYKSLCRPGWPLTHKDLLASAS